MKKIGLVLEGGGMKGIFTAGVLDFFLEKNLEFEGIIGVSAGAIQACSFMSKQKGRSRDITLDYINDKRYCSLSNLFKTGDLFDAKFAYYEIPEKLNKFDNETFEKSKSKLWVVATDIVKGKPKYLQIKSFANGEIEFLRASASLPFVANIVKYQGKEYLDGGMIDQIPIKKMEAEGYEKNVVVSTKPAGWHRKAGKAYLLCKMKYKKYPLIAASLKKRHLTFNETMDHLETGIKAGNIFLITPNQDFKVKRLERNRAKLEAAYYEGYETAKELYPALIKFINN